MPCRRCNKVVKSLNNAAAHKPNVLMDNSNTDAVLYCKQFKAMYKSEYLLKKTKQKH